MYESDFNIREFSRKFAESLHPSKPVYRKCGWRNGRRVYKQVGWWNGKRYIRMKRNPYLSLQLRTGDPVKMRRQSRMLRFFRKQRRWTMWFDRPKGFWKGVFGL